MTRILVATVPLTGHVQPMCVLVERLVDRGHSVHWYTGEKFAETVRDLGARFVPMQRAKDWDDAELEAAFPSLRGRRGLARVKTQLRELFIAPMVGQLADLEDVVCKAGCDLVLADSAHLGAALLAEKHGIAWASLGISALMVPSVDTAPFGSAIPPGTGRAGELRNKLLNQLVFRLMFGSVNRAYRRARVAAGLPAGRGTYFEVMARDLFLQPTVPSFEYPRRDLPPQVRFIGPLVRTASSRVLVPWWQDVLAARARGTPIVLITQGTMATDPGELIAPALVGLASEDVLVVVTGREAGPHPPNARVAPYVPYEQLLPHVAVMVTNAGYGGVQMALRHGVPLVAAGRTEEKPEIAARIAWSGAGIDLRTGTPAPEMIRTAVRRVLHEPRFRARAREIAAEMRGYDAATVGADFVEDVIRSRCGM